MIFARSYENISKFVKVTHKILQTLFFRTWCIMSLQSNMQRTTTNSTNSDTKKGTAVFFNSLVANHTSSLIACAILWRGLWPREESFRFWWRSGFF